MLRRETVYGWLEGMKGLKPGVRLRSAGIPSDPADGAASQSECRNIAEQG
jgi:hypothetical protein